MIIFEEGNEHCFVTQKEHARLSLKLIQKLIDEPEAELFLAVEHHDDGWLEYDAIPKLDSGSIVDYRSVKLNSHLIILEQSVKRCGQINPYAGWLVSRHVCSFYKNNDNRKAKTFIENQKEIREKLFDKFQNNHDLKTRKRHFNWLQFVDALSLYVLDPWNEEWNWDRDHPGTVRITATDSKREFGYEGLPVSPGETYKLNIQHRKINQTVPKNLSAISQAYAEAELIDLTIKLKPITN